MSPTREATQLTANDFFTGLFATLKLRGQTSFSIRGDRFDSVMKDLYEALEARSSEENLEVLFRVRPHRIYGDSKTVRKALRSAAQRRIISFDNPDYLDIRIQLDEAEAARKLQRLGVPQSLLEDLADQFLQEYRARR